MLNRTTTCVGEEETELLDWAMKEEPTVLCSLLSKALTAYQRGTPFLTDFQYDLLGNYAKFWFVGTTPKKKVKLPYPLFSLNKIKPSDPTFMLWFNERGRFYVLSDKIDGNSIALVYTDGVLIKAYTRGDGIYGQDISSLIPRLGQPLKIKTGYPVLAVRAEVVMRVKTFEGKYASIAIAKGYKNPRNLVAGIINSKTEHAAAADIHSLAYEVIFPRRDRPSNSLKLLQSYGIKTVPYTVLDRVPTAKYLTEYFNKRRQVSDVEIDGIVVEQDVLNQRPENGNPDYAVAFKLDARDSAVEAEVIGVEWNATRHGKAIPVVLINPIELGGVTIGRASGFNAHFIKTGQRKYEGDKTSIKPIGVGAKVLLARSGDVIPHIVEIIKPAVKPDMPHVPYSWDGLDIKYDTIQRGTEEKILVEFFTALGIDFIKQRTVGKFIEHGLNSVEAIINADVEDFKQLDGVQEKTATKWHRAIKARLSAYIDPVSLMLASGVVSQGIGRSRLEMVFSTFPDIVSHTDTDYVIGLVSMIKGFDTITATLFAKSLPRYRRWLKTTGLKQAKYVKPTGTLDGVSVAFTGFRDKELADYIVSNGGSVDSTVKKTTAILLATITTSEKAKKAEINGTEVMTMDAFMQRFDISL